MSLFDRVFTCVVMLPLQVGLGVFIGSRSRVLGMLLVAIGAFCLLLLYRKVRAYEVVS